MSRLFAIAKYPEYKGTRKPMPQELKEQIPLLKEMLEKMGIATVSLAGFEADDILGTLAKNGEEKGLDVIILSGDRDLLQLATKKTMIRLPRTAKGQTVIEDYKEDQVQERYLVSPAQIIELKALMGDPADNIPGIPGVGEKTAIRLLVEYGSIENAFSHVEEISQKRARESLRENYQMAQLSKELATICTNSPIEFEQEKFQLGNIFTKEAYELCRKLDFRNFLMKFDPAEVNENTIEQDFFICNDLEGCEALLEKAGQAEAVGIALLWDKEGVYGAGLALGENEMYYVPVEGMVTAAYLSDRVGRSLGKSTAVCSMDVKTMLERMIQHPMQTYLTVALQLLWNPLKSTYTYEELAKDYLDGKLLPGKEELLGKISLKKAWEEDMPNWNIWHAIWRIPLFHQSPPGGKLQETGMWKVYTEIELPLVFTLDSMEK